MDFKKVAEVMKTYKAGNQMIRCRYCGEDNPQDARFCNHCGRKIVHDADDTRIYVMEEDDDNDNANLSSMEPEEEYEYIPEGESAGERDLEYYESINRQERELQKEREREEERRRLLEAELRERERAEDERKRISERKFRENKGPGITSKIKSGKKEEDEVIIDRDNLRPIGKKRGNKNIRNIFLIALTLLVALMSFYVLRFVSDRKSDEESMKRYNNYVFETGHTEDDYKNMLKDYIGINERLLSDYKSASKKEGRIILKKRIEEYNFAPYLDSGISALMGLRDYDRIRSSFSQLLILYNVLNNHGFEGNIPGEINAVQEYQSELSGIFRDRDYSGDPGYSEDLISGYEESIESLKESYKRHNN